MHFCPNCGSQIPESSRFCPNCGYEITTSSNDLNKLYKEDNNKTLMTWGWVCCALAIFFPIIGVVSIVIAVYTLSKSQDNINHSIIMLVISIILMLTSFSFWAAFWPAFWDSLR